ncbi:hypothetical protein Tco_0690703 [Tanacetum coccineum]
MRSACSSQRLRKTLIDELHHELILWVEHEVLNLTRPWTRSCTRKGKPASIEFKSISYKGFAAAPPFPRY